MRSLRYQILSQPDQKGGTMTQIQPTDTNLPAATPKQSIDQIAGTFYVYQRLREQRDALQDEIDRLELELRNAIGDAHEATINGQTVLTYAPVNKMRTTDLKKDNPDLYKQFVTKRVVEEFDPELFKQMHPELYGIYQSRSFRLK